jgi:glycerophosphoryl diester phosphodiesterase
MRYYIPNNIISIAHRGYSAKYRDNSLAAFKNVKKKGFQMMELDIQLSKNNEIVICHDLFIKNIPVNKLTTKQLKKKGIITLKKFFNYFDSNHHRFYLDMKGDEKLAHYLFCFLKTYEINISNVICCSFNMCHIELMKLKMPEIKVGFITYNKFSMRDLMNILKDVDYFIPHYQFLDKEIIDICHLHNVAVFTYTMDSDAAFIYIQQFNIDGIVSNYRMFHSKANEFGKMYYY